MKKDSIGYVVAFTFAACAAFVLPLALANEATKERVEANRLFAAHSATLRALGIEYAGPAEAEEKYASLVTELPGGAWAATIDGTEYRAVRKTGSGLWGSITMIVAADATAERLRGVEMLDQQETPGLGGRIDEAWFKEQFRGERVGPAGVSVDQDGTGKGDPDRENGRVDAVTGASRTSDFVEAIVNAAIADIRAGGAK
jgi:Na+-transporting NADH:ubiquinone oxidoreductase subunit C